LILIAFRCLTGVFFTPGLVILECIDMPQDKKKIVVIGGGTGTHTLLRGLKRYADRLDITAIVTMADSGGSTGRLRDEFGQLPVGDARMALVALAADFDSHDELLRELFLYRFSRGEGLNGHNFGNLLLTALTDILGSEVLAIEAASRILRVRGQVVPVTTDNVNLQAVYDDDLLVVGEHEIDMPPASRYQRHIKELSVTPFAMMNKVASLAMTEADVIVLGPGDLYTSVLANCVVGGFVEALANSKAKLIYVCNLMSRLGQTIDMHSAEHVAEISRYTKRPPDFVLINNSPFPAELLDSYKEEGNHPIKNNGIGTDGVLLDLDLVSTEAVKTVSGDILERSLIRHDSDKLATALLQII